MQFSPPTPSDSRLLFLPPPLFQSAVGKRGRERIWIRDTVFGRCRRRRTIRRRRRRRRGKKKRLNPEKLRSNFGFFILAFLQQGVPFSVPREAYSTLRIFRWEKDNLPQFSSQITTGTWYAYTLLFFHFSPELVQRKKKREETFVSHTTAEEEGKEEGGPRNIKWARESQKRRRRNGTQRRRIVLSFIFLSIAFTEKRGKNAIHGNFIPGFSKCNAIQIFTY